MKLNLNGVEIELPNNAKVDVSKDGKHVKVEFPEQIEKIRVVEVPGETERIVERIKIVEVEKPCTHPHYYPSYPTYPTCPTYPNHPWITWTSDTQLIGSASTISQPETTGGWSTTGTNVAGNTFYTTATN